MTDEGLVPEAAERSGTGRAAASDEHPGPGRRDPFRVVGVSSFYDLDEATPPPCTAINVKTKSPDKFPRDVRSFLNLLKTLDPSGAEMMKPKLAARRFQRRGDSDIFRVDFDFEAQALRASSILTKVMPFEASLIR